MKILSREDAVALKVNSTLSRLIVLLVTISFGCSTTIFAVQKSGLATIDVPGATSTGAASINDAGVIVGHFVTADGKMHGYSRYHGHFHTFDAGCGGGDFTDVAWINSHNQIVGTCGLLPGGVVAAYVKTGHNIKIITYPGAQITTGYGISDAGDVVGVEIGTDGTPHGYLLSHGHFSRIDFPGAVQSYATMTLGHELIVGNYSHKSDGSTGSAFVLRDGHFHSIHFPKAVLTWISGINERGDLSGFYLDTKNNQHGFVRDDGQLRTVDLPGAASTQVGGINDEEDIVGSYTKPDGSTHGFLLVNHSDER